MKTKEPYPIRLDVPCLPDKIYVSYEPFDLKTNNIKPDILQNQSGRNLIKDMANLFLDYDEVRILTKKNEKPKAYCEDREVSVSFSHTHGGVSGVMSFLYNVGCDMENIHRKVHPKLVERLRNKTEQASLYEDIAPVRIWTLKESALKMIGTGLRKPMNSVCVTVISEGEFEVEFDDGKRAKICSFQHRNHWISVCYRKFADR